MIFNIRPASYNDLSDIMLIYSAARDFMSYAGNANQWINGYPTRQLISEEINDGYIYVCENHNREVTGVFSFIIGEDPTYLKIYNGEWLNDNLYGTIHRIASSGKDRGVAKACFEWCFSQCSNIRVDTHRNNHIMQHILDVLEFKYCGVIYLTDGSERLAYQKSL